MFADFSKRLNSLRNSSLLHNTGWMFLGQGLSVMLQAGYFILLARLLGAEQSGVFAGAFAFVAIFAPYASMGSGTLFMRYVGADSSKLETFLGNALLSTVSIGGLFVLALYLLAPWLLNPASASLVLPLALANCIFNQVATCSSQIFQTFEKLKITAILSLLVNAFRFLTILGMIKVLHRATAFQWSAASLAVTGLSAASCMLLVRMRIGKPHFQFGSFVRHIPEGFGFSLGGSAQSAYNDVDKTLLSHYGLNLANGIYTLAYRVIDMATLPITALDAAALPRYFRQSKDGHGVIRLAVRLGKRSAAMGLLAAVVLFLSAHLLPLVLGAGFAPSVSALRWLCLIPALRGWHQLTGSAIAGLGFQRYRTTAQFSVAGLNLLLNLWLIPRFGWLGAAWASLASDGLLCVLNWIMLRRIRLRHLPFPSEASEHSELLKSLPEIQV